MATAGAECAIVIYGGPEAKRGQSIKAGTRVGMPARTGGQPGDVRPFLSPGALQPSSGMAAEDSSMSGAGQLLGTSLSAKSAKQRRQELLGQSELDMTMSHFRPDLVMAPDSASGASSYLQNHLQPVDAVSRPPPSGYQASSYQASSYRPSPNSFDGEDPLADTRVVRRDKAGSGRSLATHGTANFGPSPDDDDPLAATRIAPRRGGTQARGAPERHPPGELDYSVTDWSALLSKPR